MAALLIAAGGVTWMLLNPPHFTATSVFSLRPEPGSQFSADILLITAHEYVAYVSSPDVMTTAAAKSGVSAERLASSTEVSVENGTTNVRINVTLSSSVTAVRAVNELASVAEGEGRSDRLVDVKVVSLASAQSADITPPRRLILVVTGVLSVLVGSLVWYMMSRRSRLPGVQGLDDM